MEMAMREKRLKIEVAASRECEQQMEVTRPRVAMKRKKGGSPRWLEEKEVDSSKTSRCL